MYPWCKCNEIKFENEIPNYVYIFSKLLETIQPGPKLHLQN